MEVEKNYTSQRLNKYLRHGTLSEVTLSISVETHLNIAFQVLVNMKNSFVQLQVDDILEEALPLFIYFKRIVKDDDNLSLTCSVELRTEYLFKTIFSCRKVVLEANRRHKITSKTLIFIQKYS